MIQVSKTVNLLAFTIMHHSSLNVFMTNKTPRDTKRDCDSTVPNQKGTKWKKILSSSDRFKVLSFGENLLRGGV